MEIFWVEFIGYTAGILTLINMLPQVIKSWKTKSVEDISFLMILTYTLSMLFWVIYAYFINSWPIMTTNSVALVLGIIQLSLIMKYKK